MEAVLQERLRPILVDVDPTHWHLDLGEAKKAITRRTVAMISVDWLGTPVHLEEFRTFADENNLTWISDSAQSFGATWHSKPAVGVADATIYSLGYPKVFHTAGRGGILVVRPECAELLCDDPTQVLRHEIMPELNAAFGLSLLPALNQMLAHRRLAMKLYRERLSDIPGICFPLSPPGAVSNGYQISMKIDPDRFGAGSKDVIDILIKNGIEASANRVENLARLFRAIPDVITSSQPRYAEVLDCFTLTVPTSNHIPLATCEAICRIISQAHRPKIGRH